MNPMHKPTLATAFAMLASAPTLADWETTRWGMSPADALAAVDDAIVHDPAPAEIYEEGGQRYAPLVKASHSVEEIAGEISLLFDTDDKLHFVLFNPADIADCDALGAALTERHGPAETLGAGTMSISDWVTEADAIKLTDAPGANICNLSYSAR